MKNTETGEISGLALLRVPFEPNQISKLPKPTKTQTEAVKADFKNGIRCLVCGTWHHPDVIHLDYVGHAALTDRLLDADPTWTWEPVAMGEDGQPKLDSDGGMWIKLTVCGVTRLGYGDAQGKTGGNAVKERIGDALRNAAMRFGAALDLWHKGDLHGDDEEETVKPKVGTLTGPITPTSGAKDNISPEERGRVDALAGRCLDFLNGDSETRLQDAVALADEAEMGVEETIYFWTKFDSKQRSAMKVEAKARRQRALDAHSGSQP